MDMTNQNIESIFCHGPLLHAVQTIYSKKNDTFGIFEDCKYFVDMSLKNEPEVILEEFKQLSHSSLNYDNVKEFVEKYFNPAGEELEEYHPPYYSETIEREFIEKIVNVELQSWSKELIALWSLLCRQVKPCVRDFPNRYTIIPRLNPMIIPGGRFRETYYWDSYFIVRGLLISGRQEIALGMVENLLDDVKTYGFVPNGSRIYYLNRSQPPLLSEMVMAVFQSTKDVTWLSKAVPILHIEYHYWMSGHKIVQIQKDTSFKQDIASSSSVCDEDNDVWVLNRYHVSSEQPRPESYREDIAIGALSPCPESVNSELATAAESGWDFSSRWMAMPPPTTKPAAATATVNPTSENVSDFCLSRSVPTRCVPVDLNAILYRMENNMSLFHSFLGKRSDIEINEKEQHASQSTKFQRFAIRRQKAIEAVLWDEVSGRWKDAWLQLMNASDDCRGGEQLHRLWRPCTSPNSVVEDESCIPPKGPYLSDYAHPLWAGLADGDSYKQQRVITSLTTSGLLAEFGVATSLEASSSQQWDFPNSWPPLIELLVEGLERSSNFIPSSDIQEKVPSGPQLALKLAQQYVTTAFNNYYMCNIVHHDTFSSKKKHDNNDEKFMYEKYDAQKQGIGRGGEYLTQVGFGWSNGTALIFLERYGHCLTSTAE